MKSYTPGTMSPAYIEALRQWQLKFLESITCSEEDAQKYREMYPDWVAIGEREKLGPRR